MLDVRKEKAKDKKEFSQDLKMSCSCKLKKRTFCVQSSHFHNNCMIVLVCGPDAA